MFTRHLLNFLIHFDAFQIIPRGTSTPFTNLVNQSVRMMRWITFLLVMLSSAAAVTKQGMKQIHSPFLRATTMKVIQIAIGHLIGPNTNRQSNKV